MSVIPIKGVREAPKSSQSKMETILITPEQVAAWVIPPFQRPLRINDKVRDVAEKIKKDEWIEGVLTLGKLRGDNRHYIVDGQHRVEAFKLSEITEAGVDVRYVTFDTMSEMADEFVRLNSSLVKMRPDDILRGMESSLPVLKAIRAACDFVGYDQIRRGASNSPIVGMSALLRCWVGSSGDVPNSNSHGKSASGLAEDMTISNAHSLIAFLGVAYAAWGRDPEYYRLWGNLNMTICMWLFRRLVMEKDRGLKRYVVLNHEQFKQCLMSLSASPDYLPWLQGRLMNDRDRSPCYARVKAIFAKRLGSDLRLAGKAVMPQPPWSAK